jgi:cytochrome b
MGDGDPADAGGAAPRVWDLPLRLCHWGLALAVAAAFASHYAGTAAFAWHVRAGCAVLALVAFRVAWGFVGTRHARFASFVRGPRATLAELRALGAPPGAPRAGHTVLGGWMALTLLGALLVQALTGLVANDGVLDSGPLAAYLSRRLGDRLSGWHEAVSSLLLVLVALHVAAALGYRLLRHDDRIGPLVTGRRAGLPSSADIGPERRLLAVLLFALAAALVASVVLEAPPPPDLD